ncbi:MAG: hypothetical protein LBQ87_06495 [Candidatus Fibromonas sp.]|nr:hypothetical protein [Candidatus Fibromonas sp.]
MPHRLLLIAALAALAACSGTGTENKLNNFGTPLEYGGKTYKTVKIG